MPVKTERERRAYHKKYWQVYRIKNQQKLRMKSKLRRKRARILNILRK